MLCTSATNTSNTIRTQTGAGVINSTFRKIFNTKSQETVDVRLEMFGCLQAERTIAIRKRKFLNRINLV